MPGTCQLINGAKPVMFNKDMGLRKPGPLVVVWLTLVTLEWWAWGGVLVGCGFGWMELEGQTQPGPAVLQVW